MTNAYADLDTLKSVGVLNITGSDFDARLLSLLENVSRWIDDHCGRRFYTLTDTRHFDGDGSPSLPVPDLVAVTALRTDDDGDGVFERTWPTGDYLLYPPERPAGTALGTPPFAGAGQPGPRRRFPPRAGPRWRCRAGGGSGRCSTIPEPPSARALPSAPTDTALTVTGGGFAPGQTIMVGSEQLYVAAVASNVLTVRRGGQRHHCRSPCRWRAHIPLPVPRCGGGSLPVAGVAPVAAPRRLPSLCYQRIH